MTHPNYPRFYPNDLDSTQTIEVAVGKTIRFSWIFFNTEPEDDYVQFFDKDWTNLTPKLFGQNRLFGGTWNDCCSLPIGDNFSTDSNFMHVKFITDSSTPGPGWKLKWTEV